MSLSTLAHIVAVPITDSDYEEDYVEVVNQILIDVPDENNNNTPRDSDKSGFLLQLVSEVYEAFVKILGVPTTPRVLPDMHNRRQPGNRFGPPRLSHRRRAPLPDLIQSSTPPPSPRDHRSFVIPPSEQSFDLINHRILRDDDAVSRRLELGVRHIEDVKRRWRRYSAPSLPSESNAVMYPPAEHVVMLRSSRQSQQQCDVLEQWMQVGKELRCIAEVFESQQQRQRSAEKRPYSFLCGLLSNTTMPTSYYIWSALLFCLYYHFSKKK